MPLLYGRRLNTKMIDHQFLHSLQDCSFSWSSKRMCMHTWALPNIANPMCMYQPQTHIHTLTWMTEKGRLYTYSDVLERNWPNILKTFCSCMFPYGCEKSDWTNTLKSEPIDTYISVNCMFVCICIGVIAKVL